jgi:hypothetical protein
VELVLHERQLPLSCDAVVACDWAANVSIPG